MIFTEILDGFIRHYSDTFLIRKIGTDEVYSEAVDLPDTGFSYIETDIEIEEEEPSDAQSSGDITATLKIYGLE